MRARAHGESIKVAHEQDRDVIQPVAYKMSQMGGTQVTLMDEQYVIASPIRLLTNLVHGVFKEPPVLGS